jgi:CoA:oxalate CoA-transferase
MVTGRPRIVDLTDQSAVYATRLLADLGAEVIRIERPGAGPGPAMTDDGEDASRRFFNASKRSLVLDVTRDEGRETFVRLCARMDAVVEGLEPILDPVDQMHARIRAANPSLTWVAVRATAPDAEGPHLKSAEVVRYALSGLMSITGDPEGAPMVVGGGLSDAIAATYTALACYLGFLSARQTGLGSLIWVNAHEALLAVMQQGLLEAALSGNVVRRAGSRHAHIAMAGALPCRDVHVVISANERTMWRTLVEMIDDDRLRDEELDDERARMRRQKELFEILAGWTGAFAKDELSQIAQARHIPVAPVNAVTDIIADPQLRARGFFHSMGERGEVPFLRTPWAGVPRPAPRPGEDTEAVLLEAGFSRHEIDSLEAHGIVVRTGAPV